MKIGTWQIDSLDPLQKVLISAQLVNVCVQVWMDGDDHDDHDDDDAVLS